MNYSVYKSKHIIALSSFEFEFKPNKNTFFSYEILESTINLQIILNILLFLFFKIKFLIYKQKLNILLILKLKNIKIKKLFNFI